MSVDKGTAESSPHYNKLGNDQPILKMLRSFSREKFIGYLEGNVVKYRSREGLKEGTNDKAKADQYQKWLDEYTTFELITIGDTTYHRE